MSDRLIRALARDGKVRVFVLENTATLNEAKRRFDLWPTAATTLGRTMSATTMLSTMLKGEDEKITVQINGGGPIGTILVDGYSNGYVRGFVGDPHVHYQYNDTGKLAVGVAVGKEGYLKVIRDLNMKEDVTGQVALQTGEIGDDFAYYFAVSEQVPSVVSVGVYISNDNEILASGGLLIQMMPDATEEDIIATEEALKALDPISTMLFEGKNLEEIATSVFADVKILSEQPLGFYCPCSRETMKRALITLSKADRIAMIEEDKGCEITCNYCNEKYYFGEQELIELEEFIEQNKKHRT